LTATRRFSTFQFGSQHLDLGPQEVVLALKFALAIARGFPHGLKLGLKFGDALLDPAALWRPCRLALERRDACPRVRG